MHANRHRPQRYDHARRCEESRDAVCHCRCGAQFHGARRIDFATNPFGLAALAPNDPHYVPLKRHPHCLNLATSLTGETCRESHPRKLWCAVCRHQGRVTARVSPRVRGLDSEEHAHAD